MKVFVTGATGFTGSYTVPLLLKNGYQLRCLYRPGTDLTDLPQPEIEWTQGDVSNTRALAALMQGTDVLINLVSLGFGHADPILCAAKSAGIPRAIFLSTTAIFTPLDPKSKAIRMDAEHLIKSSGLQYTILRPTMIYGGPRDRNMWRLIRFVRRSPVIPNVGNGAALQQPIFVTDAAQAVLRCLKSSSTIGRSYNIAGRHPLTYNQVIDTVATQMHKRIWKLYIPDLPIVTAMKFLESVHVPLPIKAEQILRLNEDKTFDCQDAANDFGYSPLSFEEGIRLELGLNPKERTRSR